MTNNLLQIKIKERLNKLASLDYDNFECWQIVEAFNKAQLEWVRRQINGVNSQNHGEGSSKVNYDDLQKLLVTVPLGGQNFPSGRPPEFTTNSVPTDYLNFASMYVMANSSCCPEERNMIVYMVDKEDLNIILRDENKKPNFEWAETVAIMTNNTYSIYTDGDFQITSVDLTYFKKPTPISFLNCIDISTGLATPDVECEFKDDIAEILVDNAVAILAADIESFNQYNRANTSVQNNT